jgi:hypothetical protein
MAHPEFSAEKVRGGVIILSHPWQRVVFLAGVFGGAALLLVALIFGI